MRKRFGRIQRRSGMSCSVRKSYRLGDYVDIQNGYAFKAKDFFVKGIPIIKIKNLVPPKISFNDVQYFDGCITDNMKQFLIKKNDILISLTGSHLNQIASAVGKVSRYQFDYPALLNQRVGKVFVKNREIGDETYLYYYLSRFDTQVELVSSAGGSANQANISPSQIKNLLIDLPTLSDQIRIASILSALDEKIELNCLTNQTLEAISQAIYKEWFVNFNFPGATGEMQDSELGPIPRGWRVSEFTKELNIVYGKNLPTSNLMKDGYPVFGGNGFIGFFDKYLYEVPHIIVACRGAASGKVNQSLPKSFVTNNSLVFEIPKKSKLNFAYLKQFCLKTNFTSYVSGSAQPQLTIESLKGAYLMIPEESVLKKFNELIFPFEEMIRENDVQSNALSKMRDNLLPKLLNGEIEV